MGMRARFLCVWGEWELAWGGGGGVGGKCGGGGAWWGIVLDIGVITRMVMFGVPMRSLDWSLSLVRVFSQQTVSTTYFAKAGLRVG